MSALPDKEYLDVVLATGKSRRRGTLQLFGIGSNNNAAAAAGGSNACRLCFINVSKQTDPISFALSDSTFSSWMEQAKQKFTATSASNPMTNNDNGCVLKVGMKNNTFVKFLGLPQTAHSALNALFKSASKELVTEHQSTRGANWGHVKVDNHRLLCQDSAQLTVFDVPIHSMAQAVNRGKGELAIEFSLDDDPKSASNALHNLVEIGIYVPNDEREEQLASEAAEKEAEKEAERAEKARLKEEKGEMVDDSKEEEEPEEEEEEIPDTAAQLMVKDVMGRIGGEGAAMPVCTFDIMFNSPRGKYTVDMYPTFLKLHNKTFQYKILYKYIMKMFLFENPQTNSHFFVIGVTPPVRQGRTAYPFLLVSTGANEAMEVDVAIDEKECQDKYQNMIQPHMVGPAHTVVSSLFKALTQRKCFAPSKAFQSAQGGASVRCNLKASDGFLYCMEKSFFFVRKPLHHIRHGDIQEISFERLSGTSTGSKSFDLKIVTNEEKGNEYVFSHISRDEYQPLYTFLKDKNLNVTSQFEQGMTMTAGHTGRMRTAANYDEEHDPHMQKINAAMADDDDSEEDSDFEGGGSSSSSSSSSEGEESEEEEAAPKKRKKPKQEDDGGSHAAAAASSSGDGKKGTKRARSERKGPQTKSAYFMFLDDARPKLWAEKPELKSQMAASTSILATQWKALDADTKAIYTQKAAEEKERVMAEFIASGGKMPEKPVKAKRAGKSGGGSGKSSKGGPQKPRSALLLFIDEKKEEIMSSDNISAAEARQKLTTEWSSMDENQQQPYVELHLEAKKTYKKELAEWEAAHPDGGDENATGGGADADGDEKMDDAEGDAAANESGAEDDGETKKKKKKDKKKDKKKEKKKKKDKKKEKGESGDDDADMQADEDDQPLVKEEPVDEPTAATTSSPMEE